MDTPTPLETNEKRDITADPLEEFRERVRQTHRLRWERDPTVPYVEMTNAEVERAMDRLLTVMEQQQFEAGYDALEAEDYEDWLNSQYEDDSDSVDHDPEPTEGS